MNILVVGASGKTGRLLVRRLLDQGHAVKAVVRSPERFHAAVEKHERLSVIRAALLDLGDAELAAHVQGCDGVASCLGHNMTMKGMFGQPRRLVTDATRRLCRAIEANQPDKPVRFVLMNTAGNRNHDLDEPLSLAHRCVVGLIRALVPPHADNEHAADALRINVGQDHPAIQWTAVRPDSLKDAEPVSAYQVFPSPTRSAIFNPGSTRRVDVAHFMARLLTEDEPWERWRGRMPVIYSEDAAAPAPRPDTANAASRDV